MIAFAAYTACLVLALLTLFQIALIFGAPIGRFAWGGSHKVLPAKLKIGSVVAVALYGVFAVFILHRAGLISALDNSVAHAGMWVITAYFILGVFMNAISRSKPERAVMTPVALILAVSFMIVSLGA